MNHGLTKNLQDMTPTKFFQYITDKRKPKCTNDERILYNIPSNFPYLDLHNMTQLLIYSGMSNGYRCSTKEFKDMNFFQQRLKFIFKIINDEYSKMEEKDKEQYYLAFTILENDSLYKFLCLCGDYLEYNEMLEKHVNVMRRKSLDSFFFKTDEAKKESIRWNKLRKSPIQCLIDFYKQNHHLESMNEFATFLTDLYEETFVEGIPMVHEIKRALEYIMFASQKKYKFNFDSPKTRKQWKQCFLEFLSSIQEMKSWIL